MAAAAKIGVKLLTVVIGIPVGIATRKLAERAWAATGDTTRPRKAGEDGVQLADAVAWGALSAVAVVLTDVISRRSAEAAYSTITGNPPPPGKPPRAERKAAKVREKAERRAAD